MNKTSSVLNAVAGIDATPYKLPAHIIRSERETSVQPAELCVVIPTFNERGNLSELIKRIRSALEGVRWEVIVVDDDSPDGTAAEARAMYSTDARVRCIRRFGRRGLSSACIEGMMASSSRFIAVMDGDLQHDPSVLCRMYDALTADEADLVIGSRYASGGSVGQWDTGRIRSAVSLHGWRIW